MNASEDVLVGVGAYRVGNNPAKIGSGKTIAETRARADISRQLSTVVKNMVTDYTAQSEADPDAMLSFQEEITRNLSQSKLQGSHVIGMNTDDNGVMWVVMEYSKSQAKQELDSQAQAAKKLLPGALASADALDRMDKAFDKLDGENGLEPDPSAALGGAASDDAQ
jgi:hypothetical protein